MSSVTRVACPTCERPVVWGAESPWRPFCSERCKLIDLGDWAEENHRIAGKPASAWDTLETDD